MVIVGYKPKPGKKIKLDALMRMNVPAGTLSAVCAKV